MFVKSLMTGKREYSRYGIADSIAYDISTSRFAMSDGVSRSFLPEIWARILTQGWISIEKIKDFPQENLHEMFLKERNHIYEMVDESSCWNLKLLEKKYKTASATFCGVQIRNGILEWVVLGDTCLFMLLPGEHPRCISSRPMPTDESGHITPSFDNRPNQVLADGRIYGEWVRGEMPFEQGTILLMSDAMSAWFINAHNDDKDPLSQLLALSDDIAFDQWVDEQVNLGLLGDDDESVIIIQLDEAPNIDVSSNNCPVLENINPTIENGNFTEEVFPVNDNQDNGMSENTDLTCCSIVESDMIKEGSLELEEKLDIPALTVKKNYKGIKKVLALLRLYRIRNKFQNSY